MRAVEGEADDGDGGRDTWLKAACGSSAAELDWLAVLPNEDVWVPEAQDYGGICDRWVLAPSALVLRSLDVLQPVVSRPERYADFLGNPEALVKLRFEEEGLWASVRRFGRQMFTLAPRWAPPGVGDAPPQVRGAQRRRSPPAPAARSAPASQARC